MADQQPETKVDLRPIKLGFNVQEMQIVLSSLADQPFKITNGLIQRIEQEANAQLLILNQPANSGSQA